MATDGFKLQERLSFETDKLFIGTQITLRVLAAASTLAASWTLITCRQSVVLLGMTFVARYNYDPSFKFLAYANAVVCFFSFLSFLVCCFCRRGTNSATYFFLFFHDLVIMCLLLGGCAAATAIGYVGKYGNKYTGWSSICGEFGKYCHKVTISVLLSYLAVLFFLILIILSASKSRKPQ